MPWQARVDVVNGGCLTLTGSIVIDNQAVGGTGGNEHHPRRGGDAYGGGLANLDGIDGFGTTTVDGVLFIANSADGGLGGEAGGITSSGGNAYGGAVSDDPLAVLTITGESAITHNSAIGGQGATNGVGDGGALFIAPGGVVRIQVGTLFAFNFASDGADEISGSYTEIP